MAKKQEITKELIENYALDGLVPYDKNNKEHSDLQVSEIVKSIQENWFLDPIIADEKGVILAGHWRRLACIELGMKEVPVLVVTGLTDDQKKKFRIKSNRLADMAWYNIENLKLELDELGDISLKELFVDIIDFEVDLWTPTGEHTDDTHTDTQVDRNYDFSEKSLQEIKLIFSPVEYTNFLETCEQLLEKDYGTDITTIVTKAVLEANNR